LLFKAYAFGDLVKTPTFCQVVNNLIVDFYIDCYAESMSSPYQAIIDAFDILPPKCRILRALVDVHCWGWFPKDDKEETKALLPELPHAFLLQVMAKYGDKIRYNSQWFDERNKLKPCDYHEHYTDEERKKCPFQPK
jgi:hypothetical protein